MTYVVVENCIKCKYTDCVEVCPVDCFYEGENMLVIHPDECIDCGVCEPECPAEAIKPDTERGLEKWLELNRAMAKSWPNVTVKREAPPDAKAFDGRPGKFDEFFRPSPAPGTDAGRLTTATAAALAAIRAWIWPHVAYFLIFDLFYATFLRQSASASLRPSINHPRLGRLRKAPRRLFLWWPARAKLRLANPATS